MIIFPQIKSGKPWFVDATYELGRGTHAGPWKVLGHAVSFLEAISKPQIAFEGKDRADDKAQHTREYVSILKRPLTQPSGDRWGFEMASNIDFRA
jgi:hypothetical protein